jgi:N-acetylglucosamine-6-phosphate deacetylase
MIVLAGGDLVLPDRILTGASVVIDDGRIVAIDVRDRVEPAGAAIVDAREHYVVPGFVDVHVHGLLGIDTLDASDAIGSIAARLPRFGVTAFCPTTIACAPDALRMVLAAVRDARIAPPSNSARVLPAHLESNFINEAYRGAQPLRCLRVPRRASSDTPASPSNAFSSSDILDVIKRYRSQVAIVTLAPELEGGMALVEQLSAAGHRVSIGHSGATYEQALTAIEAGVSHATHLFNRMTPMTHRAPGIPGAVLQSDRVCAELICDGFHVHPAVMRLAIRLKSPNGILAITDGTAGSGLPPGSRTRLGGQPIIVTARTAELEDGTFAGSVSTMEATFRQLVRQHGVSVVDAARMCASTPAKQLRLGNSGQIAVGATADLVVLDRSLRVTHTYLRGGLWRNMADAPVV